jgi:TetR/AcrR family transcriptional repressor of nem operon
MLCGGPISYESTDGMVPRMKTDCRTRLLQAAEKAAYLYGFGSTSIADIAKEASVPLGNVYYYFKNKDEIGGALL